MNRTKIIKASILVYVLVLIYLLYGGNRGIWSNMSTIEYALFQMNLIPFKTIGEYIVAIFDGSINLYIPVTNLVGNLFMFFPMGMYVPLFFEKVNSLKKYTITMSVILLIIELTQFISRRGSFDIDDFILNMTGAIIGFGIWKKIKS